MDYRALQTELTAGHPVTGAYSATDSIAAGELNAFNIDTAGGVPALVMYLLVNRSKVASEPISTCLMGRLREVADSPVGTIIFSGETTTAQHKHAASLFLMAVIQPHVTSLDFTDTEVDAAYIALGPPAGGGCGVWKDPDIAALKGLSEDATSRAFVLGFGLVEPVDVTTARSL